ncbi:MAG: metal-dependent hydrolase [Verrucomicrobiota bacterium]
MSPGAHFIASWLIGSVATKNPRDRKLITLAGIVPDVDGLGMVVDVAKGMFSDQPTTYHYYQKFHHILCHGWPAALVICGLLACFAGNRWRTFCFCLLTFHLHLLCDLLGSRGPSSADLWPICYGEPLFRQPAWFWKGQWRLDGWQNLTIFVLIFFGSLWQSVRMGNSFVEVFSRKADEVFVRVLRKWSAALPFTRQNPK